MLSESLPKELIIDASILFSFFNRSSSRRKVMKELLDKNCKLFSPDYVLEELINNKSNIMHFAKISESEFNELVEELNKDIDTFREEKYEEFLSEANKLSPHDEETKDDPYFALSLYKNKIPIWSDEIAFKKQSEIKVFSTKELLDMLEEIDDSENKESADKSEDEE